MYQLKDASFGWINQICRFTFASHNTAHTFDSRNRCPQMEFSVIIYLSNSKGRGLRRCGVEKFCVC